MSLTLADVPIEVVLDHLLPTLPVSDLLNLGSTNHALYGLTSDETFWHRKLQEDFNFPESETARTTGWKFIYKRLSNPHIYVWGESSQGRLGLPSIPTSSIRRIGVPYPVRLQIPGVRIVSLVGGGMSFHAIDAQGNVYVWGALNGATFALQSDGFSEPGRRTTQPMKLVFPNGVLMRSISCGRLHSAGLDANSIVWTFTSWGTPFRIDSPFLDRSTPETTPAQVECGWVFTSILTKSADVLVYWPTSGGMERAIADKKQQWEDSNNSYAKAKPHTEGEIPCYPWDLTLIDPVRLPGIPVGSLPDLPKAGITAEEAGEETKLIRIAALDNTIIGLTNKGHVLRYSRLHSENDYREGRWNYLPYFSDIDKVSELPVFQGENSQLEPPTTMRITHISAHYETFIAYSTGPHSLVLMCKIDPVAEIPAAADTLQPNIIPSLQYQGVISVVMGDYHFGALTSTGKLLTWGEFSKGAIGLGDPVKIDVGSPGGFRTEQHRQAALNADGWERTAPPTVVTPTEVKFDHGMKKKREKYCFGAAAGGWHMGALVIDLDPGEEEEEDTDPDEPMPGAFPNNPPNPFPIHQGLPILGRNRGIPFRVGYAGRGIGRGGGQ